MEDSLNTEVPFVRATGMKGCLITGKTEGGLDVIATLNTEGRGNILISNECNANSREKSKPSLSPHLGGSRMSEDEIAAIKAGIADWESEDRRLTAEEQSLIDQKKQGLRQFIRNEGLTPLSDDNAVRFEVGKRADVSTPEGVETFLRSMLERAAGVSDPIVKHVETDRITVAGRG